MSIDADAPQAQDAPVPQALQNRSLSDARCIAEVLAGNRQRFEELVVRYQNAVVAVARAYVKNEHSAEDVAQEIFVLAFSALGELRDPAAFGPWLMQIARRHAAMDGKRGERFKTEVSVANVQIAAPQHEENRVAEVFALVEQLPEPYRSTVIEKYQRNLSCKEIAENEGVAISTITSRLTRALVMLRAVVQTK
jgi:RNA polymerase sigma-70 factor, ECF subfamily